MNKLLNHRSWTLAKATALLLAIGYVVLILLGTTSDDQPTTLTEVCTDVGDFGHLELTAFCLCYDARFWLPDIQDTTTMRLLRVEPTNRKFEGFPGFANLAFGIQIERAGTIGPASLPFRVGEADLQNGFLFGRSVSYEAPSPSYRFAVVNLSEAGSNRMLALMVPKEGLLQIHMGFRYHGEGDEEDRKQFALVVRTLRSVSDQRHKAGCTNSPE